MDISVIDCGLGNIASVGTILQRLSHCPRFVRSPADHERGPLVLPGVGAFDAGVERLRQTGWYSFLTDLPPEQPLLGICLGMQLLCDSSEEGTEAGLGLIPGHSVRFATDRPVPHMGWNEVSFTDVAFGQAPEGTLPRFYFVHSYHYSHEDASHVRGWTTYDPGQPPFASVVGKDRIIGVQFHPEKSHRYGMRFFSSLLESWCTSLG